MAINPATAAASGVKIEHAGHSPDGIPRSGRSFRHIARAASVMGIALGSSVLLDWFFDLNIIRSIVPAGPTMKANTAASFVLAGVSLQLQVEPGSGPNRTWIARSCALVAASVGLLTLLEYVRGRNIGIDQLLVRVSAGALQTASPGRMAPNTALCVALLGTALALLDTRKRWSVWTRQALSLAACGIAFVAVCGYAFSVEALYGVAGYSSMAVHTATVLAMLSLGALCARPKRGIMAILAQDTEAAASARRMVPVMLATPLVLGWLQLQGEHRGLYGVEFGTSLTVTTTAVIMIALVLGYTRVQSAAEVVQRQVFLDEQLLAGFGELVRSARSANIIALASKQLGKYLAVSRCFFAEVDVAGGLATIEHDFHDGLPSLAGTQRLSSYGPQGAALMVSGETIVSRDTSTDARTAEQYKGGYGPAGLRAFVSVPLMRDGRWVGSLVVSMHEPRAWQPREVKLMKSVAERSWLWLEHLRAEQELARSADQFRLALEAAPTGMLMIDGDGKITLVNSQIETLFGYGRGELLGKPVELLVPARFGNRHASYRTGFGGAPVARRMGAGRELHGLRKDGSEVPVEIGLNPLRTPDGDFVLCSVHDVTERVHAERERASLMDQLRALNSGLEDRVRSRTREIEDALKEREVLLQEVHHRVKNNLQVISSLINLQARKLLADTSARCALEDCKARVETIALIHETLYQSRDYARVPFSEYAGALAKNITHVMGVSPARIVLHLEIEAVSLGVDKAIPCGLILNELITNALKHGFPAERSGTIRIELRRVDARMHLSVRDDGIGMPAGFDPRNSPTLGLRLVTTLVEQIDGQLEMVSNGGTEFRVVFPHEVPSPAYRQRSRIASPRPRP